MKILEVLDSFYPQVDGPVNVIVNIAKALNDKKLAQVDLLVPKYRKVVDVKGINIYRCPAVAAPDGYMACMPDFSPMVKDLIKNGGYDLIHVHSPFPLGKYAIRMAKKYKIPSVITVHTKFKSDFERILKSKPLQTFMLKYIMKGVNAADYVLSVSKGAGETIREYGYKGKEIYIIRNGTDMKPSTENVDKQKEIIERYNLQNKFVFLFVGRVVENKNIQFSLEVLKKIKEKGNNNFKFLIVGSGAFEDDLKKLVKKYNLKDNVEFVGKITDRDVLATIYQVADLFLFPSTFDTCGIVVIEAAANKLASVLIKDSCASELVTDKENGLIFPEDSSIWADGICEVMKTPEVTKKMGERAFETLYFKWDDIALEYYNFYRDVLDGKIPKNEKPVKKSQQNKKTKADKKEKVEKKSKTIKKTNPKIKTKNIKKEKGKKNGK